MAMCHGGNSGASGTQVHSCYWRPQQGISTGFTAAALVDRVGGWGHLLLKTAGVLAERRNGSPAGLCPHPPTRSFCSNMSDKMQVVCFAKEHPRLPSIPGGVHLGKHTLFGKGSSSFPAWDFVLLIFIQLEIDELGQVVGMCHAHSLFCYRQDPGSSQGQWDSNCPGAHTDVASPGI
jgi:hypothetical protein